ncbi:acyltransferase family protein [Coprococcus catus]
MLTSIIVFICTLIFLASFLKSDTFMNREATNSIKGFCMLLIMAHHIMNTVGYPESVVFLRMSGFICTGIYFFFSGYGNYISLSNKEDIGIEWLTGRLKKLYRVFLVCYAVNLAILLIYDFYGKGKYVFSIKKNIAEICIFSLPETINWFPKVFIVLLVMMFIIFKFVKNNRSRILLLTTISVIYVVACVSVGADKYWYNSVFCFPLGAFIAMKRKQIELLLRQIDSRCHMGIILVFFLATIITAHFWGTADMLQIIPCIMFCALLVLVLSHFNIRNAFLEFVGINSFEFYLIHVMWFNVLKRYAGISESLYSLAVYILTFVCVLIYKKYRYNVN